jgi:hypothetical protein
MRESGDTGLWQVPFPSVAPLQRADHEIEAWSRFRESAAPGDNGSRAYISGAIEKAGGAEPTTWRLGSSGSITMTM